MRANATFNLHIRLNSNSPISIKASEMELYLMCVGLFFFPFLNGVNVLFFLFQPIQWPGKDLPGKVGETHVLHKC